MHILNEDICDIIDTQLAIRLPVWSDSERGHSWGELTTSLSRESVNRSIDHVSPPVCRPDGFPLTFVVERKVSFVCLFGLKSERGHSWGELTTRGVSLQPSFLLIESIDVLIFSTAGLLQ